MSLQALSITPCVLRAGQEATLAIRGASLDSPWRLTVSPMAAGMPASLPPSSCRLRDDGAIEFTHRFGGEQEHTIVLERVDGAACTPLARGSVYSLKDDLFALRPFKGDFHLHSNQSDGAEPPAHVAAHCRRIGLDFMALTDHARYQPSLDAAAAFDGVPVDLRIYPGEEVHAPGSSVHIVNFGAREAMTPFFADVPAFRADMARVAATLAPLPPGIDPHVAAASVWCFNRIRAAGGLAVFCHPYWVCNNRFDVPEAVTSYLLDKRPFDALELIGGYSVHEAESNALQVARWNEECRRSPLPVVGASDAHGCLNGRLFGWYFTLVLAADSGLDSVIEAVKDCRAVAVEARPGEQARIFGPFRLTLFAHFLLRTVMRQHDELCRDEGALMLAHVAGDPAAAVALAAGRGRVPAFIEQCWVRPSRTG